MYLNAQSQRQHIVRVLAMLKRWLSNVQWNNNVCSCVTCTEGVVSGPNNLELLVNSVTNHANTCKHHLGRFYHPPSSGVQCLV